MVTVTSASQNHIFDDAKIIVIKVGSPLLVDEDQNAINTAWLSGIATDIARLRQMEKMLWWYQAGPSRLDGVC